MSDSTVTEARKQLRDKYGVEAVDAGVALQGPGFEKRLAQRDALDPHFTKAWLDYQITGLSQRPALDMRTRFLVLIGQYTMAKSQQHLDDTLRAALAAKVKVREILEIILQCVVYGGHVTVDPAIETFHKIAEELNLLPEIKQTQLPMDGTSSKRNRAEEELTSAETREVIAEILNRLPENQRQAVELAFFRGLSQRQIAAETGIPVGTIKTRLQLALAKIERALKGVSREFVSEYTTSAAA